MKVAEQLRELERVADALGVKVSYEPMTGLVSGAGGLCRVKGQYRVIIDRRLKPAERTTLLADALRRNASLTLVNGPAVCGGEGAGVVTGVSARRHTSCVARRIALSSACIDATASVRAPTACCLRDRDASSSAPRSAAPPTRSIARRQCCGAALRCLRPPRRLCPSVC